MTPQEIAAALTEIHTALVAKLEGQPYFGPNLTVAQSGKCGIALWKKNTDCFPTIFGDTFTETISKTRDFIAALPDPELTAKQEWHRDLGKVIERGEGLAFGTDVIGPLRVASEIVSGNLLAAPSK